MFSPEASIQSARSSLRNPRRRPRNSDGPQQQQPRRKRSKLGDETFVSVSDGQSNGNGSAIMNGHVGHSSVEGSMVLVDMPVREKKGPVKRAVKDDTALYLVSTTVDGVCARTLTDTPRRTRTRTTASRSYPASRPSLPAARVRGHLLHPPGGFANMNYSAIPSVCPFVCRSRSCADVRPSPPLGLHRGGRSFQGPRIASSIHNTEFRPSATWRNRAQWADE